MLLAIDASISSTGYAILDDTYNIYEADKITTSNKKNTEDERVFLIANKLELLIKTYEVSTVILESQYAGKNIKTAMQLSRLRGAITYIAMTNGCELLHKAPSVIRRDLMGDGSASKEEVAEFTREFYKNNEIVKALGDFNDRQCKAKNSDIYDAIAIGTSHVNQIKM